MDIPVIYKCQKYTSVCRNDLLPYSDPLNNSAILPGRSTLTVAGRIKALSPSVAIDVAIRVTKTINK
jgi:hypothetical protein